MKRKSIVNNFIFQMAYQAIIIVVPLIISPYLTRILQSTQLGIYAYVNSIASYFVVLANLGIAKHGQRSIARILNDETKLRRTFWSLFFVHILFSLLSLVLYFLFVLVFVKDNVIIYLLQSIYVLSALFDITWLFYGLENFKSVVIKNSIVKIVECVLIFTLVKSTNDLWIYTLITMSGFLLGQIFMIPQAIKLIKPIGFCFEDMRVHIKPIFVFSISVIAVSLYTIFDKTILGILDTKDAVAFYEYANRIITLPKMLISVVGTIMFPRACKLVEENDRNGQAKYLKYSLFIIGYIGFASLFGLLSISNDFSLLYYGEGFEATGKIMMSMCALPLIVGVGDIVRTQYMIPSGMDKQYILCSILNAAINVILSVVLVPIIGVYGAVIGTTCAELFGCIYQIIICRKHFKIRLIVSSVIPFFLSGTIMYVSIFVLKRVAFPNTISAFSLASMVFVGFMVYSSFLLIYMFIVDRQFLIGLFRKIKKEH